MVIDDDESIRFVLNHLFSKNGFKVATLAKADAAFSVIDVFKPILFYWILNWISLMEEILV